MSHYSEQEIAMMENWRELREAKGISLDQISLQTNITVKKLEAIESHSFENLGNETFVMGYLRSYAKILGEDPQIFLQVYRDAVSNDGADGQAHHKKSLTGSVSLPQFKKFSLLQISVGVIVLWGLIMMIFSDGPELEPAAVGEPASESSQEASSRSQQPEKKYEDSIDPETVKPVMTPSPKLEELEQVLATVLPEVPEASNDEGVASSDASALADVSLSSETSADGKASLSSGEASNNRVTSLGEGEDLLVLAFIEECWLEVKDSSGSVLIAELQRKGDNLRVFGEAPFEVMLGDARAASLTLNGDAVAIKPRPGRKTLRFTIPR